MGGVLFDDAGVCYLGAGVFAVWFIGGDYAKTNVFICRAGKRSAPAVNTPPKHPSRHRKP